MMKVDTSLAPLLAYLNSLGIAGGPRKCAYLTDELGLDATIDYKNEANSRGLERTCPDGIDIFFDNVGGKTLDAALARINVRARVIICGAISQYNNTAPIEGPNNYLNLLMRSSRLEGFIYNEWHEQWPVMIVELANWYAEGRLKCPDDIVEGGVNVFPDALLRLFSGDNFGKLMIKVAA